jgi:formamidopyrimidine-DNA glycosylase
MPELPEVETVRMQLRHKVVGKTIDSVEVFHAKSVNHDETIEDTLRGKIIADIDRVGKLMIFSFTNEADIFLLAHLKMTGQFFYVDADGDIVGGGHTMTEFDRTDFPHKHSRVAFHFTDHTTLYFNDMRLFGYLQLVAPDEKESIWAGYGIEPGTANYTWKNFEKIFERRKTTLKALLLNQKVVSGLGNIYVDEACFRSGVLPFREVPTLKRSEKKALFQHCSEVMMQSIERGGTTFYSFLSADGKKGNFSDELEVFDRAGQPCYRCGNILSKIKHAGRGTHFCSTCQK